MRLIVILIVLVITKTFCQFCPCHIDAPGNPTDFSPFTRWVSQPILPRYVVALDFFVNDFLGGFRRLYLTNLGVVIVLNAFAQFVILLCVHLAHMRDVTHPHLASAWQQIVQNAELHAPVKIILVEAEPKRPFQYVRRNLAHWVFITVATIHHRDRLLGIDGRLKGRDVRPQDSKATTLIAYRRTATTPCTVLVLVAPDDNIASLPPRLQLALPGVPRSQVIAAIEGNNPGALPLVARGWPTVRKP